MERPLPSGVRIVPHQRHDDPRGGFTEVFRDAWGLGFDPIQWNLVSSRPDTVRGVHLHLRHYDYLMAVTGELHLGLKDLREDSPQYGLSVNLVLRPEEPQAVCIPPGVAHGFFFPKAAIHLYAVSEYWSLRESLSCHWSDPGLGFSWSTHDPLLSDKDAAAGPLSALVAAYHDVQAHT
jgi:dTDP-4-dehydrorhamnose 3,5-epimerase